MSTRYGLSLKLDMDNSAFEENRSAEAARILRRLADKLETSGGFTATINTGQRIDGRLSDSNGNSCGTWEAKPRRIRD
jgi:hypothetical protein